MHENDLIESSEKYGSTPTGRSFRQRYGGRFYSRFLFHLEREAQSSGILLGGCLLPLLFPLYFDAAGAAQDTGGTAPAHGGAATATHHMQDQSTVLDGELPNSIPAGFGGTAGGSTSPGHATMRAAHLVTSSCSAMAALFLLGYYVATGPRKAAGMGSAHLPRGSVGGALPVVAGGVAVLLSLYGVLEYGHLKLRLLPDPLTSAEVCFGFPAVFLASMYAVLVILRRSFTIGEGILIAQCNVLLAYLFYLVIVEQRLRLTKLRCVILLGLFGAIFIAGHIFCLHFFCCKRRKTRDEDGSSSGALQKISEDTETSDTAVDTDIESVSGRGQEPASLSLAQTCGNCLQPSQLFFATTLLAIGFLFHTMSLWIQENSLVWIFNYVTHHTAVPLKFLAYYAVCLVVGLFIGLPYLQRASGSEVGRDQDHDDGSAASTTSSSKNKIPQIVLRKYFHAIAIVMFVPSILVHIRFTSLAFAVAFSLFLVLEAFRSAGVSPIAELLTVYLSPYIDKRDGGTVILTHMYLLLGCAVPVWYAFFVFGGVFNANSLLIALSGISCTGVGDSCASIVGAMKLFPWETPHYWRDVFAGGCACFRPSASMSDMQVFRVLGAPVNFITSMLPDLRDHANRTRQTTSLKGAPPEMVPAQGKKVSGLEGVRLGPNVVKKKERLEKFWQKAANQRTLRHEKKNLQDWKGAAATELELLKTEQELDSIFGLGRNQHSFAWTKYRWTMWQTLQDGNNNAEAMTSGGR
eukprot:g2626.t1